MSANLAEASELVERWWGASAGLRDDPWWTNASAVLGTTDRRVLLVGPGPRDPYAPITEAVREFLARAGLVPEMLDGRLGREAHLERARQFPRIVAVPLSVGSSTEVLDLLAENMRDRLSVVLPKDYGDGYFYKAVHKRCSVAMCGSIEQIGATDEHSLGAAILSGVGELLLKEASLAQAQSLTSRAPSESSIPARLAREPADEAPAQRPGLIKRIGRGLRASLGKIVIAVIAGLVVLVIAHLLGLGPGGGSSGQTGTVPSGSTVNAQPAPRTVPRVSPRRPPKPRKSSTTRPGPQTVPKAP
jgi:hypothetical protein